jgi:hypothetical protein
LTVDLHSDTQENFPVFFGQLNAIKRSKARRLYSGFSMPSLELAVMPSDCHTSVGIYILVIGGYRPVVTASLSAPIDGYQVKC